MKKLTIVGIALAMGMLSVGAISASAASLCCNDGNCTDKQIVQKVIQETAAITSILKVKENELRDLYGYDSFDSRKAAELESEIQGLKSKIMVVEENMGFRPAAAVRSPQCARAGRDAALPALAYHQLAAVNFSRTSAKIQA